MIDIKKCAHPTVVEKYAKKTPSQFLVVVFLTTLLCNR